MSLLLSFLLEMAARVLVLRLARPSAWSTASLVSRAASGCAPFTEATQALLALLTLEEETS